MKRLRIVQEGTVYQNRYPGHVAAHAYVSNLLPLLEEEVLCFYRIGQAFYSHDGRIGQSRSANGGRTWEDGGTVWDPANDESPYSYTAPHGFRLRDGSLVLLVQRTCASEAVLGINPDTGGSRGTEKVLLRSLDDGRTWSEPEKLELPCEEPVDTPSSIIELDDGRWFLGCEEWKAWDDSSPLHIKGFALFSSDSGQTWGDRLDFISASHPTRMYSHSRFSQMRDGRICALQMTHDIGKAATHDLHLVFSDESGKSWSAPHPTGIYGETSWAGDLGEKRMVAVYTVRKGSAPGIFAVFSDDCGKSWKVEDQIRIWDATGRDVLGDLKLTYPRINIAFGKPNIARLPNGDAMCSWWCTANGVTHIRYARLALR